MPGTDLAWRQLAAGFAPALTALSLTLMMAAPAYAQEGSRPLLGGDEPVEIVSDRLEVREEENIAIFTGNVQLVQGDLTLRTVRMVVHYSSEGGGSLSNTATEVERIEAEGSVYLKSGAQVATGERGHFDMQSDTMVLTGSEVVLTEGPNVVKGCRLTMNMGTGQSQVDGCGGGQGGRVIMLLQPGSQER